MHIGSVDLAGDYALGAGSLPRVIVAPTGFRLGEQTRWQGRPNCAVQDKRKMKSWGSRGTDAVVGLQPELALARCRRRDHREVQVDT